MYTETKRISGWFRGFVSRLLSTPPLQRCNDHLAVPGLEPGGQVHLDVQATSGLRAVVVDSANTRKVEIERLLAESATPGTAISFLRGLSTLSAPSTAA
jgi:hypothetical protein